jgi:hypothetical protein
MVPRFTIVDGAPAKQCCNGGVGCTVTRSYTHRARQKKSTHTHVYMHPTTAELHSSTRNSVVVASTVHHTVNNKCTAGRSPGPGRHKLVMELVSGNSARRHYCIARPSLPLPPVLLHHARITDANHPPGTRGTRRRAARPDPDRSSRRAPQMPSREVNKRTRRRRRVHGVRGGIHARSNL